MSADCKISNKIVKWTLNPKFVKDIQVNIDDGKNEIAGDIMFEDTAVCNKDICNKKSSNNYKIHSGNGDSVMTPTGLINYHTHPSFLYKREGTKYGWPSGEDMFQINEFVKRHTIRHLVFSVEGVYIIKVNTTLSVYNSKMVEKILKQTHIYRSLDQNNQKKDFSKDFGVSGKTTVDMWLSLVNNLTLNKLYKLYNKFNKNKRLVPTSKESKEKIFTVKLKKLTPRFSFDANHINEKCHFTLYDKNPT
tara:strand:+ start:1902 stop:2645 length:744 start_codon:yes stop_codon:yes gene_type:complete